MSQTLLISEAKSTEPVASCARHTRHQCLITAVPHNRSTAFDRSTAAPQYRSTSVVASVPFLVPHTPQYLSQPHRSIHLPNSVSISVRGCLLYTSDAADDM
eukprot:1551123-Rhodomonas_salina.1